MGDGIAQITVVGELLPKDGEEFERLASGQSKALVFFDSRGGSLVSGLRIGETINHKGFLTAVPDGATCASACAIAWLGGAKRFLGHHSLLGFHEAYSEQGGHIDVAGQGNAIVGAYLAHLGLSYAAIAAVTAAKPDEMNWLDVDTANRLGIATAALPPSRDFNSPYILAEPAPRIDTSSFVLRTHRVGATLDSSLYVAGIGAGVPSDIMVAMIRLFSYRIDFSRDLHPGDSFEVYYGYFYTANGKPVREGGIAYASIHTQGQLISLYRFQPNASQPAMYFDGHGIAVTGEGTRVLTGSSLRNFLVMRLHTDAILASTPLETHSK
jgi:hypothetical protein